MKVFTVVGARPQFIKAAVVSRVIHSRKGVSEILVHTGQHFDTNMSDVFFEEMEIPKPAHQLGINSMSHGAMTGRMLEGLESIMLEEKPDVVLVYGDTNSTLAGALAASKLHIPIAHVEAGLRSFNMRMPEEINRILTDRVSTWLFCPTQKAVDNLEAEGYGNIGSKVVRTGDVMYDAALFYEKKLAEVVSGNGHLPQGKFVLATLHREENTKDPHRLRELVSGLNYINDNFFPVVMPLHPGTARQLAAGGLEINFKTIDPVGYFDMIRLLKNCSMVFTDSGGLQKEAFFFQKYCITMRDQTEWVELVDNKVNILVGADQQMMIRKFEDIRNSVFPDGLSLYGQGNAGEEIVDTLMAG